MTTREITRFTVTAYKGSERQWGYELPHFATLEEAQMALPDCWTDGDTVTPRIERLVFAIGDPPAEFHISTMLDFPCEILSRELVG